MSRQRRAAAQRGGADASDDALRSDCRPAVSIAVAGCLSLVVTVCCGVGEGTAILFLDGSAILFLPAGSPLAELARTGDFLGAFVRAVSNDPSSPQQRYAGGQMSISSTPRCG